MKRFISCLRWLSLGCATVIILGVGGVIAYFVLSTPGRVAEDVRASIYQLKSGEDLSSITIDGYIEEGEWERFKWFEASSGFTVYITNDAENLYVAIDEKQNVTYDGYRENAVLGFLSLSDDKKIEVGKYKTVRIEGNGRVFWEEWNRIERLSAKYVSQIEKYQGERDALCQKNGAVKIYREDEIIGCNEEDGVFAVIAENCTDLPENLTCSTGFSTHRAYEAKLPMSAIALGPDQTLRFCGYTFYEPPDKWLNFPNVAMGRLVKGHWATHRNSAIEVLSLNVMPEEPVIGETISVTAMVKNWYDARAYNIRLTLDETVRAEEKLMIADEGIAEAHFSLVIEEPGVHEISVENMSINLTVKEK